MCGFEGTIQRAKCLPSFHADVASKVGGEEGRGYAGLCAALSQHDITTWHDPP
jgi:hypothetical protein